MLCLSGFEQYSCWVPPYNVYNYHTYAYIYRNGLNTKIHSTMLRLSGFELYSRWVPPYNVYNYHTTVTMKTGSVQITSVRKAGLTIYESL